MDSETMTPTRPTARKTLAILEALERGECLTVATALERYGTFCLSQECSRLKALGWQIDGEMVETSPGVHVKEYRIGQTPRVSTGHPAWEKAVARV